MQFSTYTFIGSALLAAGMVAAQTSDGLTVSTLPRITTCAVNRLTWSGGVAPFLVSIIVPNQSTQVLQQLGNTNNNFLPYTPDGTTSGIQQGDTVAVYVQDGNGVFTASAGIPIFQGPCSSGGSSSTGASSSTSAASSSTPATSSTAATSSTTMSTSTRPTTSATTTSAAPTTSPSGAAAPALNGLTAVIAGAVGVVAAALI